MAAGSLARPEMSGGYTDRLTDVEHSAEETGDSLTSVLLLQPDNTTYRHWAANTIPRLALDLWTGVNERGGLQFRSTYFTSEAVWDNLLVACDTAYHTRALQPSLLAWQYGDLTPGEVILPWLDNYLQGSHHPHHHDLIPWQ